MGNQLPLKVVGPEDFIKPELTAEELIKLELKQLERLLAMFAMKAKDE